MMRNDDGRWLEPSDWRRDGRGRTWEFRVRTDVLVHALSATAHAVGFDIELLSCWRTDDPKDSLPMYSSINLADLSLGGHWQYFVRLPSITPVIPAPIPLSGVGWPARFSISGLVLLHHPDPGSTGHPSTSSIGIAHRAINIRSGEIKEHREYDRYFRGFKEHLRSLEQRG